LGSGYPAVFVEDATEDALSPYDLLDLHDNSRVAVRCALVHALMWTVAVDVSLIGGHHGAEVPTPDRLTGHRVQPAGHDRPRVHVQTITHTLV
jgi:hypothetical protein